MWWLKFRTGDALILRASSLIHARMIAAKYGFSKPSHFAEGQFVDPPQAVEEGCESLASQPYWIASSSKRRCRFCRGNGTRRFPRLLEAGSLGVVYPSVRRKRGTCVACFRPALVMNVRKGSTYRFVWNGRAEPEISLG
jgi:hypothetical protein